MDLWSAFAKTGTGVVSTELELASVVHGSTASSPALARHLRQLGFDPIVLPNAARAGSPLVSRARIDGRPRIGYVGAMDEWFDHRLVAAAARELTECDFVLMGRPEGAAATMLAPLGNVTLLGERPIDEVETFLSTLDVAIAPFSESPLTLSVDPIKLYEYRRAGLLTVCTGLDLLPEHEASTVVVDSLADFVVSIRTALQRGHLQPQRVATWEDRGNSLAAAVACSRTR
jgi:glycosyltransferase involved in cell wall biosynthesis